jgi:transcriptional regulator
VDEVPFASHLPFLVEPDAGSNGYLWGHMARANPHWPTLAGEVLVIFPGPHAYISPAWYEEDNTVPTWNYIAVHVYGKITLTHAPDELRKIVEDSVHYYESNRPKPWVLDSSADYVSKMLKGIVGFKIEITHLEGKWKLNQNHSAARQRRVANALKQLSDQASQEIANLMAERLTP